MPPRPGTVSDGGAVTTGLDMMRHTGASIGSRPVASPSMVVTSASR